MVFGGATFSDDDVIISVTSLLLQYLAKIFGGLEHFFDLADGICKIDLIEEFLPHFADNLAKRKCLF